MIAALLARISPGRPGGSGYDRPPLLVSRYPAPRSAHTRVGQRCVHLACGASDAHTTFGHLDPARSCYSVYDDHRNNRGAPGLDIPDAHTVVGLEWAFTLQVLASASYREQQPRLRHRDQFLIHNLSAISRRFL